MPHSIFFLERMFRYVNTDEHRSVVIHSQRELMQYNNSD